MRSGLSSRGVDVREMRFAGSWERVGKGSILMVLVARRIIPSNSDGSVSELWVRDGNAISWLRF